MTSAEKQPQSDFPRPYGRYELLERIGEGGMAEVFRAKLPGVAGFEKILVIKRILPHLARNQRFVQMFVNEAQLAAKIQHQNIVQVYELGQVDSGEMYIAMEYVKGVDLRGILRNAAQRVLRIPIWFSVHALAQVMGGLSHAHELKNEDGSDMNVVHRDVTPSNVFVSNTGEIKLADFGIAKAVGQVSETRSGQLKGKISYMPPEQLHGQPLDARADVFAVGVVLWECLTQRRLFGGRPDFETMLAICEGKREPPSRFNPKIPPELDAVTLHALQPDRDHRIGSAREFQARLLEILPQLRPRLLPSEVAHVVKVLLGQQEPDPKLGADLPYDGPPAPEPVKRAPPPILEMEPVRPPRWAEATTHDAQIPHQPLPPNVAPNMPPSAMPVAPPPGYPWPPAEGTTPPIPPGYAPPMGFPPYPPPQYGAGTIPPTMAGMPMMPPTTPDLASRRHQSSNFEFGEDGELKRMDGEAGWHEMEMSHFKLYDGPYPFWVRAETGNVQGPISYEQMVKACDPREGSAREVSADGHHWEALPKFSTLCGLDYLAPEPLARSNVVLVERLENRSLVQVLWRIARNGWTGRLIVMESGAGRGVARREIDVLKGAPTFVYSDRSELQLPALLVRHELATEELLPELAHEVIKSGQPLEEVVSRRAAIDMSGHRALFMRDRLAELFTWRKGKVAFDEGTLPRVTNPFAPSLLHVLFDTVHRSWSHDELARELEKRMDQRLERSQKFDEVLPQLELTEPQHMTACRLAEGRTLSSLMKKYPNEATLHLIVGYILLEMDLLLVPLG